METKIVREIVWRVSAYFHIKPSDLFSADRSEENLAQLIALSLAVEIAGRAPSEIALMFGTTIKEVDQAPLRLKKYLRHIPGLRKEYDRLKQGIIKKADEF